MKHIFRVASTALALLCTTGFAMAFIPGVPPASGPGSVFHGNEEAAPIKKSKPKKKLKTLRSSDRQNQPK